MTKQESIKYISSLIIDPACITEGDQSSIALFRQQYPYFIPVRYLLALESHKKAAWNPQMRSSIQSYTGNWMLFCSFLKTGSGEGQPMIYEPGKTMASEDREFVPEITIEVEAIREVFEKQEPERVPEATHTLISVAEDSLYIAEVTEQQTETTENHVIDNPVINEPAESVDIIFVEVTSPNVFGAVGVEAAPEMEEEPLIIPVISQDYFLQQGERISEELPEVPIAPIAIGGSEVNDEPADNDEDKSLMVMMSFSEWLLHFKNVSQQQKEELKDRKALRTMWQKEKLAAAMEEENEEIPENVFEMAVNSISNEDGLVSETLADIYIKQGKYDKAIEVYRKLSLRNPQKNVYFARKIDEILKDKQS
jgi:hypothetical protein